jgi:2-polyprenyl-3-methyl-5-hydroxy-6-metoxy-1,4-benzoquinol methylase
MALDKVYMLSTDVELPEGTSLWHQAQLIGANKDVLDVGCATGYFGVFLQRQGCRVSGLEGSPKAAAEARKYLDTVVEIDLDSPELSKLLVEQLGAENFDVVNFGDILEHLRFPGEVLAAVKPLLREGGYVTISLPNIAHGDVRLALLDGKFQYRDTGILDDSHLRFFTRDTVEKLLNDSGIVLADLRRVMAPLFHTEFGINEADYPPAFVAKLRDDIEAQTYQFVVAGIPVEWAPIEEAQPTVEELLAERSELFNLAHQSQIMLAQALEQLELAQIEIARLKTAAEVAV